MKIICAKFLNAAASEGSESSREHQVNERPTQRITTHYDRLQVKGKEKAKADDGREWLILDMGAEQGAFADYFSRGM